MNESKVWVRIDGIHLSTAEKKILADGEWLSDKHIHAAHLLLAKQYPVSGLQNPILQRTNTFEVQGSRSFVQCLNVANNHWITVSTYRCAPGTITVYDSLNLRLSKSLKKVVADLIHTRDSSLVIRYANMQYQRGGSDCGLFAIATACAICNGEDPTSLSFDQTQMRQYLIHALETRELLTFPSQHRSVKERFTHHEKLRVFCVCRLPEDGKTMVQCKVCNEWSHHNCVRIHKKYINTKNSWICHNCK